MFKSLSQYATTMVARRMSGMTQAEEVTPWLPRDMR